MPKKRQKRRTAKQVQPSGKRSRVPSQAVSPARPRTERSGIAEVPAPERVDHVVQLREEELRAYKEVVETGEVVIRKDVIAEQQTIEVPVTHDEVVIERRAVDHRPSNHPIGEDDIIQVPVLEEEVTVEKQTVVAEEILVGKDVVHQTQRIADTVRREEAFIQADDDLGVRKDPLR